MSMHSESLSFDEMQRVYEEAWKMSCKPPSFDAYAAHFFLEMSMKFSSACIEELAIACDLAGASFIHDKCFIDFMYDQAIGLINTSQKNGIICVSTKYVYFTNMYVMREKLQRISLQQ